MNLLALDTSTEIATVALSAEGKTQSLKQNNVRQHAQYLLPMIQNLMQKANLAWSQLDGIIFGAGPGSFTGLRIACSIAKALAYTHQLPIFGVKSLDAIAYQAKMQCKEKENTLGILAMIDARMHEVYWAYYAPNVYISDDICVGAPQTIQIPTKQSMLLAGWGLETYQDVLPQSIVAQYPMIPEASSMITLVQKGLVSAQTAVEVLPLYVRNQVTHVGEKKHG